MISLNVLYSKLLLVVFYAKKEKNVIYISKLKNVMKTLANNAFVILMIFEKNTINI